MRARSQHRAFFPYFIWALFLCLGPLASAQEDQPAIIRFVRNPEPAPEFKLSTLDGKPISISDSKGKVVVLNFWATWCGPCRAEIPDLIDLQTKYKDQLQIIGLAVDVDSTDDVKKFAESFGLNYPIAVSNDQTRIRYGGIAALPTSFIVDTEGRIVQKHEGLRDPALYETEIRSLLGLPNGNVKVETFEDTGQIFLKHANRASQLPGVDMSKLTPEQKTAALRRFNAEACTCGCGYTLAQCRIYDRACAISKAATAKIIASIRGSAAPAAATQAPASAQPATAPNAASPATASEPHHK
jgi:thiol-disulfide isomerase/thioredoxin